MFSKQIFITALIVSAGSIADAATYKVTKGSEVSFVAKITGSSFEATSSELTGAVVYDAASGTLESGKIILKADSFDTGLGMRNRHMRDKYLNAKKHPTIEFSLAKTTLKASGGTSAKLKGTFTIKGKTKVLTIPVAIESGAPSITVTAKFPLKITDFGIPQPKYAVVKMDPTLKVTLKLVLSKG